MPFTGEVDVEVLGVRVSSLEIVKVLRNFSLQRIVDDDNEMVLKCSG